jgi:hypothetical protein
MGIALLKRLCAMAPDPEQKRKAVENCGWGGGGKVVRCVGEAENADFVTGEIRTV